METVHSQAHHGRTGNGSDVVVEEGNPGTFDWSKNPAITVLQSDQNP